MRIPEIGMAKDSSSGSFDAPSLPAVVRSQDDRWREHRIDPQGSFEFAQDARNKWDSAQMTAIIHLERFCKKDV
jgi:hypothetical protein